VRRTARNAKDRERPAAAGEAPVPEELPSPRFPGRPPNADSGSARRHVDRRPAVDPEAVGPIRTPAGVGRVSDEYCAAASSLIRWDGTSAVVGGLCATFVGGLPIAGLRRKDGKGRKMPFGCLMRPRPGHLRDFSDSFSRHFGEYSLCPPFGFVADSFKIHRCLLRYHGQQRGGLRRSIEVSPDSARKGLRMEDPLRERRKGCDLELPERLEQELRLGIPVVPLGQLLLTYSKR
jgi:hypothetical protein